MTKTNAKGFTLLELLLVLAIASTLVVMFLNYTTQRADQLRRDRTVLQMQQVLNAALLYYNNNSTFSCPTGAATWPFLSDKALATYVPNLALKDSSGKFINSYGNVYKVDCDTDVTTENPNPTGSFIVLAQVNTPANAAIIASRLPSGYVASGYSGHQFPGTDNNGAIVVASVMPPGQNLNNARSVNFAGIYSSGACVPAPVCPSGMNPAIYVTPASVSGMNDTPTGCSSNPNDAGGATDNPTSGCSASIYPISSFAAFARGDFKNGGYSSDPGLPGNISDCAIESTKPGVVSCNSNIYSYLASTEPSNTKYWRVCLAVYTEKGLVNPGGGALNNAGGSIASVNYNQGRMMGRVAVFTRCVPNKGAEIPSGSPINVWSPNSGGQP